MEQKFEKAKVSLIQVQRLWIKFRDADCSAQNEALGGTQVAPMFESCMEEHAETRKKQLQEFLLQF